MGWNVEAKNYGPSKRMPIGIVCDISSSMEDVREILNCSLKELYNIVRETKKLEKSVDLLVIFYNGEAEVRVNLEPVESIDPNRLRIDRVTGYTDTGKALLKALELLNQKKNEYKSKMIEYWQPNLFLITDGYPCAWMGAPDEEYRKIMRSYQAAAEEIHRLTDNRKLQFAAAGIQRNSRSETSANIPKLRELSANVVCISEDISGMKTIKDFIKLIGATMVNRETEIVDLIHQIM
ncbi:VWA domain-containing protein [Faecalicatena sp. Marseille-Q4148]|nr:VWA domain-containing protein [Faecalicatena sp. Marseille-Q4148]